MLHESGLRNKSACILAAIAVTLSCCECAFAEFIAYREGALLPSGPYSHLGSYMREETPNANLGASTGFRVGRNITRLFRTVLGFELVDIPLGATITSVTLTMTTDDLNDRYPRLLELYEVSPLMIEGTRTTIGQAPDGVTWNERSPALVWTNPGGDFNAHLLSSATGYSASFQTVVFGSSNAFVVAAQDALDAARPLQLILKASDTFERSFTRGDTDFKSDDHPIAEFRPTLTVEFTSPVPEPGTVTLLVTGFATLLLTGRRRRNCARRSDRG